MDEKTPRVRCQSYALIYAALLPTVQKVGRMHGYAIAVHGSMATDCDLIACPWTEDASEPEVLVAAICDLYGLVLDKRYPQPDTRSHGRLAWSLIFDPSISDVVGCGPYFDISVMPKRSDDFTGREVYDEQE